VTGVKPQVRSGTITHLRHPLFVVTCNRTSQYGSYYKYTQALVYTINYTDIPEKLIKFWCSTLLSTPRTVSSIVSNPFPVPSKLAEGVWLMWLMDSISRHNLPFHCPSCKTGLKSNGPYKLGIKSERLSTFSPVPFVLQLDASILTLLIFESLTFSSTSLFASTLQA
jgi:hypothetical protein